MSGRVRLRCDEWGVEFMLPFEGRDPIVFRHKPTCSHVVPRFVQA
jgi:hypothetical protein